MLTNISWSAYWLGVTVILLAYYSFVIVYFYRLQIRQVFLNLSTPGESNLQSDSDLFAIVHVLMDEIDNNFHLLNEQTSKQQCMGILQQLISHYPQIKGTAFQNAVNNKLSELLYNKCSIHISEQELAAVWKGGDE